jgi:hypothetical protein
MAQNGPGIPYKMKRYGLPGHFYCMRNFICKYLLCPMELIHKAHSGISWRAIIFPALIYKMAYFLYTVLCVNCTSVRRISNADSDAAI